jgi:hypothetical protein
MATCINDGCNWEGGDAGKRCLKSRFCNVCNDNPMFLAQGCCYGLASSAPQRCQLMANQSCALYFWGLVAMTTQAGFGLSFCGVRYLGEQGLSGWLRPCTSQAFILCWQAAVAGTLSYRAPASRSAPPFAACAGI